MNLELNNHKITLGPKALAFVETAYRAKGECLDQCAAIYCRDQLELWLAGGKCDPDVTVIGPARFVAKGNEIGLPKKAGAGGIAGSVGLPASGKPLPVASAAPADSEWPKWKRDCGFGIARLASPTRGDGVYYRLGAGCEPAAEYWWDDNPWNGVAGVPGPEALAWLRTHGHAKVADELERQAAPAPADPYEPVGTVPVVGDVVEHVRDGDRHTITAIFAACSTDELWRAAYGGHKNAAMYQPKIAPAWRILKRQATQAQGVI